MRFYLGAGPHWLGRERLTEVPLFISHLQLNRRKWIPFAVGRWALDSGGFTEISSRGEYRHSPQQYVESVQRYSDIIGPPDFVAQQDWMCEPPILVKTGLSVAEHQRRTIANFLELRLLASDLPIIPVIQGWAEGEYLDHIDQYAKAGVDLTAEPLVGIGGVCRRQHTEEIWRLIQAVHDLGITLHGFGVKKAAVREAGHLLASADSMAWSLGARLSKPLPNCSHNSCSDCMEFALQWREQLLDGVKHEV